MSMKLKFMRKRTPLEDTSQNQVEKASRIEALRRLREAMEQVFRFSSSTIRSRSGDQSSELQALLMTHECFSCIEKDVDQILAPSRTTSLKQERTEWSITCTKYSSVIRSCSGILADLKSEEEVSQELHGLLQDLVHFFSGSNGDASTQLSTGTSELTRQQPGFKEERISEDSMSGSISISTAASKPPNIADRKSHNVMRDRTAFELRDQSKIRTSAFELRDQSKMGAADLGQNIERQTSNITVARSSSEKLTRNTSQGSLTEPSVSLGQSKPDPLLVFDSQGNPLTDHNGVPLINVHRKIVIKFKDNKPVSHINGEPIFDQFGLPFVCSLDEPLRNAEGRPLRLYNQENIPLTDSRGAVLKLSNGNHAIVLDEHNRILGDSFGSPIYDENGKPLNGNMAKRNQLVTPYQGKEGFSSMLYNAKGFLLTDANGKPLTTASGQPLIKYGPNGEVTDLFGGPVYDDKGTLYGCKAPIPYLCVYDCEGFPLANSKGEVLKDASGQPLIVFDPSGRPISDSNNRVVYDSIGNPCNDPEFQPYTERAATPKNAIFDFEIKIFNSKGRPMLDYDGSSLTASDGRPLVVMNGGKPFHDLEGNPLYDDMGIPVSQVNGAWTCPQGSPYRAFDCQGRPLTDKRGKDLYNIYGQCLLRLDKAGRPVSTYYKSHVCDSRGNPVFDASFDPSVAPPNDELRMQVFVNESPLKIFDRFGKPLSDQDGMAMVDSQGRCLIQFNEAGIPIGDISGATIYDENRLPLGCSQNSPIISMNGLPFRLFNIHKRPLTDKNGIPLSLANEKPLIKFDGVGRPTTDITGGPVLDFRGRNVSSDPEARADSVLPEVDHIMKDTFGNPLHLFDASGWPLTDVSGLVLVNADGTHLRLSHSGEPVADPQGGPLFDQFGTPLEEALLTATNDSVKRPNREAESDDLDERDAFGRFMKDSMGTPEFDSYGRPLYDLYRRHLFDHAGRPVADVAGRRIVDGRREPTFKLPFDVRILSSGVHRACLKKANPGHYKDLLGGPLFDSDGIPLFNEHGKPLVDMYGRDLYDSQGHLQCDSNGKPLSKQLKVYLNDREIVDVRDIVKMIRVPKEMVPSMSSCLVAGKRVADSVILPGSCIVGSYPKTSSSRPGKMYWGLLRITELSDGSLIHEILKAMELDDVNDMGTGDHHRQGQNGSSRASSDVQRNEPSSGFNNSEQSSFN